MLLTCCFREVKEEEEEEEEVDGEGDGERGRTAGSTKGVVGGKKKKKGKNPKKGYVVDEDRKSTLSSSHSVDSSNSSALDPRSRLRVGPQRDGSDRREKNEKAPLQRDKKRFYKQVSQESFAKPHQETSIPFIDQSPGNPGPGAAALVKEDRQRKGLETTPAFVASSSPLCSSTSASAFGSSVDSTPQYAGSYSRFYRGSSSRRANSQQSQSQQTGQSTTFSTPNLPTSTPLHQKFTVAPQVSSGIRVPSSGASRPKTPERGVFSSLASPMRQPPVVSNLNSSTSHLPKVEERIQGRGITRSSASYGIQQLLQDQINREQNENSSKQIEEEVQPEVVRNSSIYEERLNAMKAEHNLAIQQMQRDNVTELNNWKNKFETELKRQLSQIQHRELRSLESSYQEQLAQLTRQHENELADIEENHRLMYQELAERDQAWQLEKQEVLSEIQRLKEEANRFIAVLSQEEDGEKSDEHLSSAKKQSLSKEVESLQLVLEMRTSELHRLRDERDRYLRQLEDLENTKEHLAKMATRVEDLQAQLDEKTKHERQLSLEKSHLADSFECEEKAKTRMSMQVEALQWRIKHHYELPPTQVFTQGSKVPPTASASLTSTPMHDFPTDSNITVRTISNDQLEKTSKFLCASGRNHSLVEVPEDSNQTATCESPAGREGGTSLPKLSRSKLPRPTNIIFKNGTSDVVEMERDIWDQSRRNKLRNTCDHLSSIFGDRGDDDMPSTDESPFSHLAVEQASNEKGCQDHGIHVCREVGTNREGVDDDENAMSDEGLGDISSNANSEASNSPHPPKEEQVANKDKELADGAGKCLTSECDREVVVEEEEEEKTNKRSKLALQAKDSLENDVIERDGENNYSKPSPEDGDNSSDQRNNNSSANPLSSPCDERMPSRIPLSVRATT